MFHHENPSKSLISFEIQPLTVGVSLKIKWNIFYLSCFIHIPHDFHFSLLLAARWSEKNKFQEKKIWINKWQIKNIQAVVYERLLSIFDAIHRKCTYYSLF